MDEFAEKTVSHVMTKSGFQKLRSDFQKQGIPIAKTIDGVGYELRLPDGRLLLKAMRGSKGYLVCRVHNLFEPPVVGGVH